MTIAIDDISSADVDALLAECEAEEARRAYVSLSAFVRQSWTVLEPTAQLVWNWHMEAICEHVQAALNDWILAQATGTTPKMQNLLINVPPGSAKSRIVSVCAPAWMWLRFPSWRAIFISANPRVALRDSVFCRELITSDWYQRTFRPEWEFAEDQNAKGNYRNNAGGARMAIGVGSKLTGERGDAIIVDDPHDADEVKSDTIRQGVLDWWDQTASNRVNDLRCSLRIGICQRLHDHDWSGHVLESGEWEHLSIAAEYVPGRGKLKPTPGNSERKLVWVDEPTAIGWKDPRSEEGALMCPTRLPMKVLASERERLGSSGYSAQYQQDPMAADGNEFKRSWFQYYDEEPDHYVLHDKKRGMRRVSKSQCRKRFGTADFAFSTKEHADYTVFGIWDVTPENALILVGIVRGRFEDPDAEKELEATFSRYRPAYIAIEDKQNGSTILQRVARHNRIRTRALKADTDKKTRASAAIIDMENGLFFFPSRAEWLADYEAELLKFPNGKHDDQVDVTSYAAIEKTHFIRNVVDYGTVTSVGTPAMAGAA